MSVLKHGHSSRVNGRKNSKTYAVWLSMRQRCLNPNHPEYPNYGGRGIAICDRWNGFSNFLDDMGEVPEGKSIDRFPDNDGPYSPGNCRWATAEQQALNQRRTVWLELDGRRLVLKDWAAELDINPQTLYFRYRRGWSVERILRQPLQIKITPHAAQGVGSEAAK